MKTSIIPSLHLSFFLPSYYIRAEFNYFLFRFFNFNLIDHSFYYFTIFRSFIHFIPPFICLFDVFTLNLFICISIHSILLSFIIPSFIHLSFHPLLIYHFIRVPINLSHLIHLFIHLLYFFLFIYISPSIYHPYIHHQLIHLPSIHS